MRTFARTLLAIVFFAAFGLAVFLLVGIKGKETWATLTAVLAVIAAVISAWPALRVLEIQEDSLRPRPTPYFDLTSRYGLLLLRVKNLGNYILYSLLELANCLYVIRVPIDFPSRESIRSSV